MTQALPDLIGSRICHDLISPIGAISNGLELLSLSSEIVGPEFDLLAQSVQAATARVRFFRIAFGSASAGQVVAASEIKTVVGEMSARGKITFDWQASGDLQRRSVRLCFLLLQCFECAMPWGGRVVVSSSGDSWALRGSAERMQLDPELWQLLSKPDETVGLSPATVQFALAPIAAATAGRKLRLEILENRITIRF